MAEDGWRFFTQAKPKQKKQQGLEKGRINTTLRPSSVLKAAFLLLTLLPVCHCLKGWRDQKE